MHATQRDGEILRLLQSQGFVSFRQLCASGWRPRRPPSGATSSGWKPRARIARVRGGARLTARGARAERLVGAPFELNRTRHAAEKAAIGRAAAALCRPRRGGDHRRRHHHLPDVRRTSPGWSCRC